MTPKNKLLLTVCLLQTASCIQTSQTGTPRSGALVPAAEQAPHTMDLGILLTTTPTTDDQSLSRTTAELLNAQVLRVDSSDTETSGDEETTEIGAAAPRTRHVKSPTNQLARINAKIVQLRKQISDFYNPEADAGKEFEKLSTAEQTQRKQQLQTALELAEGRVTLIEQQKELAALLVQTTRQPAALSTTEEERAREKQPTPTPVGTTAENASALTARKGEQPTPPIIAPTLFTQADIDAATTAARQKTLSETKGTIRFYQATTAVTAFIAAFNTKLFATHVYIPTLRAFGNWLQSVGKPANK